MERPDVYEFSKDGFPTIFGITYYQWWERWSHWALRVWIPKDNMTIFCMWLENNYHAIWNQWYVTDIEFLPLLEDPASATEEVVFMVRFYYVPYWIATPPFHQDWGEPYWK